MPTLLLFVDPESMDSQAKDQLRNKLKEILIHGGHTNLSREKTFSDKERNVLVTPIQDFQYNLPEHTISKTPVVLSNPITTLPKRALPPTPATIAKSANEVSIGGNTYYVEQLLDSHAITTQHKGN